MARALAASGPVRLSALGFVIRGRPARSGVEISFDGSGDVRRAAVAAQRHAAQARSAGQGRAAAAITFRGAYPTDDTAGVSRMHSAEPLAAVIALATARGCSQSWKRNDHAHGFLPRYGMQCPC